MAFVRFRGKTKIMYFRKTDTGLGNSIRDGSLVGLNDSGQINHAENDSTLQIIGVARLTVGVGDTADTDVANNGWRTAPLVSVEVPVENAVEWLIDADSDGSGADSDIGQYCAIDTETSGDCEATRVDINDTAPPVVMITGNPDSVHITGIILNSGFVNAPDTLDSV